jgi:hypothetical protein
LLEILHFGRSVEINACVKMLLSFILGRCLWMDKFVSIDTELSAWKTGFPMVWEDPSPFFSDNSNEKSLLKRMKENFYMYRGS